jgi:hypothetical protein
MTFYITAPDGQTIDIDNLEVQQENHNLMMDKILGEKEVTTQIKCEIYDTYTDTNIHHQKIRYYWANVDTPKRGKIIAESIADHEGKQIQWGQEKRFPRETIHYDTLPLIGIQATVYNVGSQVKVRMSIPTPKKNPFIL